VESTESVQTVNEAKAIVTAFLIQDRTLIDRLLGATGDPELVSALATLAASMVAHMADTQRRDPLVMWSETLMSEASIG